LGRNSFNNIHDISIHNELIRFSIFRTDSDLPSDPALLRINNYLRPADRNPMKGDAIMSSVMSKRMKIAFCCHLFAILGLAIVGIIYIFRTEFMPYHAVAVGRNWAEVDSAFQILLLALIRAFGGASFSTALAMGIILFIPFKQGILWARWAIPIIGYATELPSLFVTLTVTLNTPATPPWKFVLLAMVLLLVGLILSLESRDKSDNIVVNSDL